MFAIMPNISNMCSSIRSSLLSPPPPPQGLFLPFEVEEFRALLKTQSMEEVEEAVSNKLREVRENGNDDSIQSTLRHTDTFDTLDTKNHDKCQ